MHLFVNKLVAKGEKTDKYPNAVANVRDKFFTSWF